MNELSRLEKILYVVIDVVMSIGIAVIVGGAIFIILTHPR
jgi:hypothetical protein